MKIMLLPAGPYTRASFRERLRLYVDDSQRFIQPHTEQLQPESGLAESFVQHPTKL